MEQPLTSPLRIIGYANGLVSLSFFSLQCYIFIAMLTKFRCCKNIQWCFAALVEDDVELGGGFSNSFYTVTKAELTTATLFDENILAHFEAGSIERGTVMLYKTQWVLFYIYGPMIVTFFSIIFHGFCAFWTSFGAAIFGVTASTFAGTIASLFGFCIVSILVVRYLCIPKVCCCFLLCC